MLVAMGVEIEVVEPQTEELQREVLQIEVPLEGDFPIKDLELLGEEVLEEMIMELDEVCDRMIGKNSGDGILILAGRHKGFFGPGK